MLSFFLLSCVCFFSQGMRRVGGGVMSWPKGYRRRSSLSHHEKLLLLLRCSLLFWNTFIETPQKRPVVPLPLSHQKAGDRKYRRHWYKRKKKELQPRRRRLLITLFFSKRLYAFKCGNMTVFKKLVKVAVAANDCALFSLTFIIMFFE